MPTAATGSHGLVLQMETSTPGTYAAIAEIKDLTFGRTRRTEEVTNHDSAGWGEHIHTGLRDANPLSVEANWLTAQSHTDVRAAWANGTKKKFRLVPAGSAKRYAFDALVTEVTDNNPVSGARTLNLTLLPTGAVTEEDVA